MVGNVLLQGVGQRQAGQEAFRCVSGGSAENLRTAEGRKAPPPPRLHPSPLLSYLQRNLEAELLSIVAEDTPGGVEEDKEDSGLGAHDLLLWVQQVEMMSFSAAS